MGVNSKRVKSQFWMNCALIIRIHVRIICPLTFDSLFQLQVSTVLECSLKRDAQERGEEQTVFQKDPATFPINQQELQPKQEQRGPLQ